MMNNKRRRVSIQQEKMHVPKIIPRIFKQVAEVPIPMTQEVTVRVPKTTIQQECIIQADEMKKKKKEKKDQELQ